MLRIDVSLGVGVVECVGAGGRGEGELATYGEPFRLFQQLIIGKPI